MKKTVKRIVTIAMAAIVVLTAFAPVEVQAAAKKKNTQPVVTASNAKVEKKSAKAYSLDITAGKKAKLVVKVSGKNVTKKAKYVSDKKSVAAVNKNGVVTAKKAGIAKIKVTYKGRTSTLTVKVIKKAGAADKNSKPDDGTKTEQPAACVHNWKKVYTTETKEVVVCKCGEIFENGTEQAKHYAEKAIYFNEPRGMHSYTTQTKTIQHYSHTQCTKCGAVK